MAEPGFVPASDPQLPTASPIGEPVRGGHPDPELMALPGLEQLRRQIAGEVPESPLSRLTGLRLLSVGDGTAGVRMPLTGWLGAGQGTLPPPWFCAPPAGRVQGGIVALLADQTLSCAVATRLPSGTGLSLVELKLNLLRPLASDGRRAHAEGRVVHAGHRIAVATAEVTGADGRVIAIASGSGFVKTPA
jgi:uncharacterized protein (TIGR00369 family)